MDGRRFDEVARLIATQATRRRVIQGLAVGMLGGLFGRVGGAAAQGRTAGLLATFDVNGERFKLWAVKPETIRQLRQLQRGELTDPVPFPVGRVTRGAGFRQHNAPYSWHLDPITVALAEASIELCDATPGYVEDNLDEFVNVVRQFCPWGAKLVSLQPFRI